MARISDEVIQEIKDKTDIVELISTRVALSKHGKSYFGLCPFHNEKTPSFSVEPVRKIFNCFSCGAKGDALTFLQKIDNLSYIEAVEVLAERANVSIDFSEYKKELPHQKLYDINKEAKNLYKLYLSNTKQGVIAQEYLTKRGIDKDIIEKFNLGLALPEYDKLHKTLTDTGILPSDLIDLGLINKGKADNFYDLFRERIIFPIDDEFGNCVAFSGRTYLENDKNQAKYMNSPQTVIFTKSKILYNFHSALQAIKQADRVVLFEGYMDVIAAHRAGVLESVASMGTSLTTEQVKLIKKHTNHVTICYDGDPAGFEATSRAIKLFEQERMEIKIVLLPDKLDPDDYIKKYSPEALNIFINDKWIDHLEFAYIKNNMNIDFTKMLDIEHFKKTIFDLIKNTSNTIIESYIKRLSNDTKVSIESIRQDFNQYTKRNIRNITETQKKALPIDHKYMVAERKIINYFIKDIKYIASFNNEFGDLFYIDPLARDIRMVIEDLYAKNETETGIASITEEELLAKLNDEQLHFYQTKIKYKMVELLDKEFSDFFSVLQQHINMLMQMDLEEKIKNEPSIAEKIKLAGYRDVYIKEAKHGK